MFVVNLLIVVSVVATTIVLGTGAVNTIGVEMNIGGIVHSNLESTRSDDDSGACNIETFEEERDTIFDFCLKTVEDQGTYSFVNYTAGTGGKFTMICTQSNTGVISATAVGVHAGRFYGRVFISIRENKSVVVTIELPFNRSTKYRIFRKTNDQLIKLSFNKDEDSEPCQSFEYLIKMPSETFVKCMTFDEKPTFNNGAANFTLSAKRDCRVK